MMKLGKDTGSLINHVMSRVPQKVPVIGDGATLLQWSDRHPATVIAWDAEKQIVTVQEDYAKRIDKNGMSDMQEYEYSADPSGTTYTYRFKNGKWRPVVKSVKGRWKFYDGAGLIIGERERYYDFSF